MAIVALPAVVGALEISGAWAVVAATAAGSLGAYLDSQFVYPALGLTPDAQDQHGPRIDDIGIQTASWGAPMKRCYGPKNRLAGTIIWKSALKEVKTTTESGGKGGDGANVTTYEYFVDIAVGLCEGVIQELDQIIVEGRVIWDRDPSVTIQGTDIGARSGTLRRYARIRSSWGVSIFSTYKYALYVVKNWLALDAPADGSDLSQLKLNENATTSGFTAGANNLTGKVSYAYEATDGKTYAGIEMPLPSPNYPAAQPWGTLTTAVTEAAGNTITISQTGLATHDPKILTGGAPTVHKGTTSQTRDSTIQAAEGASVVSAYRDTAYFVIEDLALGPFGNRIPQFACVVQKDATPYTVADCVDDLMGAHEELTTNDWDADDITATLHGYTVQGDTPTARILKPLMEGFHVMAKESNGVLTFFNRSEAVTYDIVEDDLGAAAPNDEKVPDPVRFRDLGDIRLPTEVNVDFVDYDNDLQRGSAKYRKNTYDGSSIMHLDLPITMQEDDARGLAKKRLWSTYMARGTVEIMLPPSWFFLEEGDVLTDVPIDNDNGIYVDVVVIDVQEGLNGIIEVTALAEEQTITE